MTPRCIFSLSEGVRGIEASRLRLELVSAPALTALVEVLRYHGLCCESLKFACRFAFERHRQEHRAVQWEHTACYSKNLFGIIERKRYQFDLKCTKVINRS